MHVITAGNEDLVLNGVGLSVDIGNNRSERIDNVIAVYVRESILAGFGTNLHQGIANPVAAQSDVVFEHRDTLTNVSSMRVG
jgi:hypothetical protein